MIEDLAARLDHARAAATAIEQPSASLELSVPQAYAVQAATIERRTARGVRRTGVKLGFTSRAKALQMGVDDVIIGVLTDDMTIPDGGTRSLADFIHPRVEPELAFLVADHRDPDRPLARTDIAAFAAAIELIDSRYLDFRFSLADVVADNTSGAAYAVGAWSPFDADAPFPVRAVELRIDDRTVATGTTEAILGDPLLAIDAAARLADAHGIPVRPGDILLAGAATEAVAVGVAADVEAAIDGLGAVRFGLV